MAKSGGVTKLASGKAIYDWLFERDKMSVEALFASDALRVERAGKKTCQPVFRYECDRIFIRYRSDETTTFSQNHAVQKAIVEVKKFLEDEANCMSFVLKKRQVLITDNMSVLHGRTAFPRDEPRKMHRLFFRGDSSSITKLIFGFSASA